MTLAITIAALSIKSTTTQIKATPTGYTGPNTFKWYRSTTTGFTPGVGNIISGAVTDTLNDSGLIPNTIYYYKCEVTDTGHSNDTAMSSQLTVTTGSESQSQNSFSQSQVRGALDQQFNMNTISCLVDPDLSGNLYPGSPVKLVDTANHGVPVVTAVTDPVNEDVFGFINFDIKSQSFTANQACNVSIKGNVMYMYATGPISRMKRVVWDQANNGVKFNSGDSQYAVGWAFDKATAAGQLIRVYIETPSNQTV